MTGRDQTAIFSLNGDNGKPDQLGVYGDFVATENESADAVPGLVSLGFIKAAVRRSALFLFVMSVVGLFLGCGTYLASPQEYQASASLLLTLSPYEDTQTAPVNDQAMAETRAVAGLAVHELGLQQSVSSFLSTYTVTPITDRLLTVTASAPSANQAVLRANAVANAFLKFRADEMEGEQNLVLGSLNQQINQAKQLISSIGAQISQVSSQPTSPTQQSQISSLRAEQTNATATLTTLQQAVTNNQTTTQPAMTAALKGSEILSVAAVPHSRLKPLLSDAAVGLIAGFALGLVIIVLRALVSDRLRQRDDIAYALDAPVKLSVGTLRARRWLPSLPGRAAKRDLDMKRVIAYLQSAVPRRTQGPVGLAIVAVDNAPVVARAVAALATSCASQGDQVVVADLSSGAHMARLLGVRSPGAHKVSQNGVNFMLALPDRDAVPVGPLLAVASPAGPAQAGDALVASYASADLLLALVTLDPAIGGDHLATWATNAVVLVSAGQSSAERIHGVGEMIRLAGTRLDSIVLIGADKNDESLGLTRRPDEQAGIAVPSAGDLSAALPMAWGMRFRTHQGAADGRHGPSRARRRVFAAAMAVVAAFGVITSPRKRIEGLHRSEGRPVSPLPAAGSPPRQKSNQKPWSPWVTHPDEDLPRPAVPPWHALPGPRPRPLRQPGQHPPADRPPRRQARRSRLRGHPLPHPSIRATRIRQHPGRLTARPHRGASESAPLALPRARTGCCFRSALSGPALCVANRHEDAQCAAYREQ